MFEEYATAVVFPELADVLHCGSDRAVEEVWEAISGEVQIEDDGFEALVIGVEQFFEQYIIEHIVRDPLVVDCSDMAESDQVRSSDGHACLSSEPYCFLEGNSAVSAGGSCESESTGVGPSFDGRFADAECLGEFSG